ncbi:uncharacterized protein [Drosophila virilis]|uniref:SprT-like domain-containing protein n=1 Tax=Drosophila virilis TaxID=7244 RepID=B4LYG1_DROVI|nr:uncharacterized protein LOC6630658 [Drosophila virilis]EDW66957.2 uncharacterized protein Dvir_GJ23336 [Drosophila virilis]
MKTKLCNMGKLYTSRFEPNKYPKHGHNLITTRSGRVVRSPAQIDREHCRKQCIVNKDEWMLDNMSCGSSQKDQTTSRLLIYLDLSEHAAVVHCEPASAAIVDEDVELRKCLDKFLGLTDARRPLYNPKESLEATEPSAHTDQWLPKAVQPQPEPEPKTRRKQLPRVELMLFELLKQKLFEENVLRINANYFEQQTPQQFKEPIELSALPSEAKRARICGWHKRLVQQIQEQQMCYYSFLSSLNPDTPLALCHPFALSYRQESFDSCKARLTKSLFSLFNHVIFYCGLRQCIEWQQNKKKPSSCVLSLASDRQRCARFLLSANIRESSMLIETLLHQMCHAAAYVYNGETAHGHNTQKWAYRAKSLLPQLPLLADCAASYKYSCVLCRRSSYGNIRFQGKLKQLCCYHCQFELAVSACSADSTHELPLSEQQETSYMIFIRAHYLKCEQTGHSSKMRALNAEYFQLYKL